MRQTLTILSLSFTALVASKASALESIGNYSGCKRELSGAAAAACERCVGSGSFYQKSSGVCGMAPGMHKSIAFPREKPPPKPTAMPKTGSQYATIPAGSFRIGATPGEEGARDTEFFDATITITRPFLMKTTEVTQAEWHFITGNPSPSYDKACGGDCAVGYVGFREALSYLNALSKKEGLKPCYVVKKDGSQWLEGLECTGYRLPTEAEWEYAARGGTEGARYGELDDIAWHYENADGKPHPVGKKAPNAYGLFDMLGSQWEWTWDKDIYEQKPFAGDMSDPISGPLAEEDEGRSRVVRGGSYKDSDSRARAAHRFQSPPAGSGSVNFGFRPVRTVFEKKK